jgi:histidinol-phosphate/aromatic aminotransferase/cobyric acid decarboxylase-like protein/GTP:adenosylcobinamide-phosphate guanylyltransferase
MQAIILAAGMGKRLGEFTRNNTKCMVEVNGVRLIDRMLIQLSQLDLKRVVIVVGYKGQELIDYIGNRYKGKVNIEFVTNPIYDKTNNIFSLSLAKDKMQEDDTLLLESDLIFEDQVLQAIVDNPYPNLALVAKYETWMDGTVVRLDDDDNIVNFIPKKAFKYEEVAFYYKTVNIYKFSKAFSANKYVPFLDAYCKAVGNNEYYENVLRIISFLNSHELKAMPIGKKKWYEIDDVQDLNTASSLFQDSRSRLRDYTHRFGGYWRFPGTLDYCLLVNPYFPPQRMIEEMKANFEVLLRDYPSGMGINSMLGGKYFNIRSKYVAVGNGAAELIKSLVSSVTGRLGVIYPTFEEYPNRIDSDRIVPFVSDKEDFSYTIADLQDYYSDKNISALLLINPDNPSGHFIATSDILKMSGWCAGKGIRLIVDESFVDFSDDYATSSLLKDDILERHPELVVIKSISKSYGVPGLRLGLLATSDEETVKFIRHDVAIWNINSFAEFYMQIFNKYDFLYKEACAKFVAERKRFKSELKKVPYLKVLPSQANFFLCQVQPPLTASELTIRLLESENILIKDCESKHGLEGKNFVRIAVHNTEENDRLVAALKQIKFNN